MEKQKASTKAKSAKKGPKQGALPGMEDRALRELEALAEEYVGIRDQRMELTEQETELNDQLLALMKKHNKTEYHHGEVHCWVKSTDEKVKVKLGELTPKQKKAESGAKATDFAPPSEAKAETSEPESIPETQDAQESVVH